MRWFAVLLASLAACGGVSPDPARMAAELPSASEVDAATAAENRRLVDEAARDLAAGDHERARSLAETVLKTEPTQARARAIRAATLAEEAKESDPPELVAWRRAEGELRRASALGPDDPVVAMLHARFLRDDGHWSAAVERIESLLSSQPDDLEARRFAGFLRYDLGDERASIGHLEPVAEARPDDAESLWRIAHASLRVAQAEPEREARAPFVDRAQESFRRYQELEPADVGGWLGEARARVVVWGDSPDDVEAAAVLSIYAAAADVDPTSPEPPYGRAVILERLGNVAAAEAAYREALTLDGAHTPSLVNLTANLADQGRLAEARAFARRALEQDLSPHERRALQAFLADTGSSLSDT